MPSLFQRIWSRVILIVMLGMMVITYGTTPGNSAAPENMKPLEKAFPHSEKCKRCHLRVFEEWEASAQSRSIVSAPFYVSLKRYVASGKDKDGAMCFRCHAPSVVAYPDHAAMYRKEVESKDPKVDGVGCSQCHLIKDVDPNSHPPHPSYQLERAVFGSYKNPVDNLAHDSVPSELYHRSQYCITCHEILPSAVGNKNIPDLLGPWQQSRAEQEGKSCQACHMPEAFGESANGERNRKIANHSFPGRFGKVRADAVTLEVNTEVKGEISEVTVTVQSLVPHNLPLPHPGWSRAVLDLTILGKNLRKTYNEQRHYERVFGDAQGKETIFDFEAVKVLKDTVLKPEEKRVEVFKFPTPKDAPSMDVIVTMSYAEIHGPKDFLKEVEEHAALGRKDRAFQPVQIFKYKKNISLRKNQG